MNNKTLLKILSVFLCLCLVLGVAGCKPKNTDNSSSNLSSGDGNTADDNTVDNTDEDTNEDTTDEDTDDDSDSDFDSDSDSYTDEDFEDGEEEIVTDEDSDTVYDDGEDDDSDDYVFENKFKVLNGSAPILTNYRGTYGAVYHGSVYMHDTYGRDYTDEMAKIEIDRFIEAGYKVARTYWRSQWFWDDKAGNFNFNPATNDKYKQFIRWAKELQKNDVKVMITTGWHLTSFLTSPAGGIAECRYIQGPNINFNDGWTLDNVYGELDGYDFSGLSYDEAFHVKYGLRLGNFAAMSIEELRKQGVNNVTYVLPFVEPSYWSWGSTQYEGPDAKILLNVMLGYNYAFRKHTAVKNVKIVGPNQGSVHTGYGLLEYFYKYEQQTGKRLYDVMTAHFYATRSGEMDDTTYSFCEPIYENFDEVNSKYVKDHNTREFWQDEWGASFASNGPDSYTVDSSWNGLSDVVGIVAAMQHKINAFIDWNEFDQLWIDDMTKSNQFDFGIHKTGNAPSLFESSIPYANYYPNAIATKYLTSNGGGTTYKVDYDVNAGCYFGAMKHADGNYTLIFVNMLPSDAQKITVKMDKAFNKTMYRHVFDAYEPKKSTSAKIPDPDRVFKSVGNQLTDTIPAASCVVYSSIKR